ncbi:hypothetical protein SAMN02799624_05366 [Paenibacillus sp. UNC496MF]|uniref:hypothetical protein n=1 Tax=Paenibacillus sp. UNC496MF TaxID=1502753 RepID=UPI0008E62410|nr:hypothetical protein [Paenibacillus sp. UNC496MF]SFJ64857.1 hypothetical protein SAMN02799624_05366 [Paenibacillus sp. UNC496MF]
MFPFDQLDQSGMILPPPPPCEHEVMIHCVQALNQVNENLMQLSETIAANAASIRKTLEAMIAPPAETIVTAEAEKGKSLAGVMKFPGQPGVYAVQIDPLNPQAAFDIIDDLIKKKFGGGHGGI